LRAVTTTYNSISRTVEYLSDIPPHPTASVIPISFPTTHAEIIETFKAHVRAHPAKPNKKRVAVIDSIISNPGALLPWKEMVNICKDEDIFSVIDAAHSIGQEVGINLKESDPDFWVSVCNHTLSPWYTPTDNGVFHRTAINGFPESAPALLCMYPKGRPTIASSD
jgi:hypothetical protein